MNTNIDIARQNASGFALEQNRVLRNTYMLLGLSMVPTVARCAGRYPDGFQLPRRQPVDFLRAVPRHCLGFHVGYRKNKNSGLGVALLLGFTFFMGLMLSRILQVALGFSNGGSMIALAAGGTGAIFFTCRRRRVSKRDFTGMGKFLFVGMISSCWRGGQHLLPDSGPVADHCRGRRRHLLGLHPVRHQPHRAGWRNQLRRATLAVYLDIYNVFVSLLQLIMAFTGERD
jgi:modulator of FtsH protease